MSNVLPFMRRVRIIAALVECVSIRGASRLTGADKNTVMNLGVLVGLGCLALHDRLVRGIAMSQGEADEIWTYCTKHERRKRPQDPPDWGDEYTFFIVDADTRLVPGYKTGKRDLETALEFMTDLRQRVVGKPQLSVDGWIHWPEVVGGPSAPKGATWESSSRSTRHRLGIGRVASSSLEKSQYSGHRILAKTSTNHAERVNLTTRSKQRRLVTSPTPTARGSEKASVAAVALHFMHYNFVRVHEALGTTPAVAAGANFQPHGATIGRFFQPHGATHVQGHGATRAGARS